MKMKKGMTVAAILVIIIVAIAIYLEYMFSKNDNNDNVLNYSWKNISTINESDPNGTNEEVSLNDTDYHHMTMIMGDPLDKHLRTIHNNPFIF